MIYMKKFKVIILSAIMIAAFSINAEAQKRTYYYYPSSNVYYDISGRQYVFNNGGSWVTAKTLPSGIILTKGSPRVTVYHPGNDVWTGNANHVVKYKNYKAPKMKPAKAMNRGRAKKS